MAKRPFFVTFFLQLKEFETTHNTRKRLASGKAADISHEEKLTLQKEIKEQEVLLQGYQKVYSYGFTVCVA